MTKTELAILTHLLMIEEMLLLQYKYLLSEEHKQRMRDLTIETQKLIMGDGGNKT